jgi:hypothetical protein
MLMRGGMVRRPAGAALQRGFQLPDRRPGRAAYAIQRHAGTRLAGVAHHLQPAITGIEPLRDCRRWLRRTTEPLHLRRPQQPLGSVRLAGRLLSPFAGTLQADPGAPDAIAKNAKSAAASHVPISSALGRFRNTPAIGIVTGADPTALACGGYVAPSRSPRARPAGQKQLNSQAAIRPADGRKPANTRWRAARPVR